MNKYSESLMYKMNKDLPYEQQVKSLLHHYDRLMEENQALKVRIKEMEDEKAIGMLWIVLGGGFGSEILIYWLVWYLHRKGWV